MIAAAHAVFGEGLIAPRCGLCRRESARSQRKAWGCDGETDRTVFTSSCTACDGNTDECETCHGQGQREWKRCPSSQATPWARTIAETWGRLHDGQGWPNGRPWGEQPNDLYEGVQLFGAERSLILEALQKLHSKRN